MCRKVCVKVPSLYLKRVRRNCAIRADLSWLTYESHKHIHTWNSSQWMLSSLRLGIITMPRGYGANGLFFSVTFFLNKLALITLQSGKQWTHIRSQTHTKSVLVNFKLVFDLVIYLCDKSLAQNVCIKWHFVHASRHCSVDGRLITVSMCGAVRVGSNLLLLEFRSSNERRYLVQWTNTSLELLIGRHKADYV